MNMIIKEDSKQGAMHSAMQSAHQSDIPLKEVKISGLVCGLHGEIIIAQLYRYAGKKSAEIIYTFPVPDQAAVTGFSATIGVRTVQGEIREKEEAFKEYDEAVLKGDGAFLLEQFRPNIFQVSLGQVLPGEEVAVKVTYLDRLIYRDGETRLLIPTLVAPRYIPGERQGARHGLGWAGPTDQVPDADFITPPVSRDALYRVELDLILDPLLPLQEIDSPSHDIVVTAQDGQKKQVKFKDESVLLDRDIVITGKCREENVMAGSSWRDEVGGYNYFYLSLYPELGPEENRESGNYIFLIDISGSMSGNKLAQAKNVLQLCMRNLEAGDTFNIIAFESRSYLFALQSVPFDQASLESAGRWVDALGPMGGTEILGPVKQALQSCDLEGTAILLFTDGQVGNEEEIIREVEAKIGRNRLFTFGIDTAVNSYFINKLAEAGRGLPEYVMPGERIEDKVLRQFARITSPIVTDIEFDWGMLKEVEVYPETVDTIFDLDPVTLVARSSGDLEGEVALTGRVKDISFRTAINLSDLRREEEAPAELDFLKRTWGKMKIERLENALRTVNPRRQASLVQEIIRHSIDYGVLSAHTSFVAIMERENKATGIPETVVVPVAPAAEWAMLEEEAFPVMHARTRLPGMRGGSKGLDHASRYQAPLSPASCGDDHMDGLYGVTGDFSLSFEDSPSALFSESPALNASDTFSEETFKEEAVRLIALQQLADGSFPVLEDGRDNREEAGIINTATASLAMMMGAGGKNIYRRQLEKAALALLDALAAYNPERGKSEQPYFYLMAAFTIKTMLNQGAIRKNNQDRALEVYESCKDKASSFSEKEEGLVLLLAELERFTGLPAGSIMIEILRLSKAMPGAMSGATQEAMSGFTQGAMPDVMQETKAGTNDFKRSFNLDRETLSRGKSDFRVTALAVIAGV